jgi:hypothetical protein
MRGSRCALGTNRGPKIKVWRRCRSGLDVGALGKELVDETELAITRRCVENGHALLQWENREAV